MTLALSIEGLEWETTRCEEKNWDKEERNCNDGLGPHEELLGESRRRATCDGEHISNGTILLGCNDKTQALEAR
jgi:hypothetical protein